ncbi:choline transporter [Scheffersomyces spartinae]|uniref:Choline transporter n=1 Tax=Scheffersomyces spartinae TaxID=45513 RepID=A0A9P7V6C2_9ASCO|nr:choline transporter [Scheffersomyces spartinae]KAG7191734.1 choline transporter [Scheffersomyces spartinae]
MKLEKSGALEPHVSVEIGEIKSYVSNRSLEEMTDAKATKILSSAQADLDMAAETGYKPELRRNFSVLSLLGVGFGLTNSWFGISASLITSIASGGPMIVVYGIIIVALVSSCIAITLSELISAYPNAGGQYYWTMKLAPKKYAPFLSYLCGALAWAGSVFTSASVTIAIASSFMGMVVLGSGDPNKTVKTWQVFVVYQVANLLLVFFNLYEKPLPAISKGALGISLISFFTIMVVVLAKADGKFQSAHFVFVQFTNGTGWNSSGIAFIVGLINPNWSFSCLDAATHMAEEMLDPRRQIPIAIIGTVIIGFVTSFSYSIAMFFSIRNLEDLYTSRTGVPIMDIFYQVLGSRSGAIGLEILIFLTAIGCNIASHTWQARLCWSFARDNGLPGSKYWRAVSSTGVPVNAHLMSCAWCAVIGCIYMGSTTAYNAMVVGCIIFLLLSYLIPTVCLLIKGRNNIPHGPFWCGTVGLISNCVLIFWAIFATVFYSLPAVMPVTQNNMNYVSAVFVGYTLYCVIYWMLRGKHRFTYVEEREAGIPDLTHELSHKLEELEVVLSAKVTNLDTVLSARNARRYDGIDQKM